MERTSSSGGEVLFLLTLTGWDECCGGIEDKRLWNVSRRRRTGGAAAAAGGGNKLAISAVTIVRRSSASVDGGIFKIPPLLRYNEWPLSSFFALGSPLIVFVDLALFYCSFAPYSPQLWTDSAGAAIIPIT